MEYSFTLKFKLAEDETGCHDELMRRLGEAGCTDAMIGLGLPGYVSLEFIRQHTSAVEAIVSALEDVKEALPRALLAEAGPDFVGLTDIAEVAGVSRQNMRKLFINNAAKFPPPVHGGSAMVWHLAEVLKFMRVRDYPISASVFDVAYAAMQVNLTREKSLLNSKVAAQVGRYLHA